MNEICTKEEILAFQKIAQKDYGKTLSYAEAADQATRLIMLFETAVKDKAKKGDLTDAH